MKGVATMMQPYAPGPLARPAPAPGTPEWADLRDRETANPWLVNPRVQFSRAWHPRTGDLATVPGWLTVGSYN